MRLAAIATHIPDTRQTVADCVVAAGGTVSEAKAFGRLFGIDTVAVTPADQTVQAIFGALIAQVVGTDVPDTVIYVHGNPVQPGADGAVLAHVRAMLPGVARTYEMDQQNCSTLFWALERVAFN
jgi:3-oxoacyl-[acyl-carrier-protein] synthase III